MADQFVPREGVVKWTPDRRAKAIVYVDVPDVHKHPSGPYRQAPPEYGAQWWLISPFSGDVHRHEPWIVYSQPVVDPAVPVDAKFADAFGAQPKSSDYDSAYDYRNDLEWWRKMARDVKQISLPPNFDPADVQKVCDKFRIWGMGQPRFYEAQYGWIAFFREVGAKQLIHKFESSAWAAILRPDMVIMEFQVQELLSGRVPAGPRSPFVPRELWPDP